ncbi:hypothetical protein TRFO_14196 [Tritrichomonas foetus]|uniref:Uncharacterized protein n=1 Tax=Tritrichomonas foetus TaxID=1144522 RepID=A0A1J4L016_9EUKA|nr:hypothetical protein TRFO_14196 [Tritrichomonas foetus]|eukprot:OHT15294.1 hypothetical protein TRFO_14196 [Tritrichomonas foetus]
MFSLLLTFVLGHSIYDGTNIKTYTTDETFKTDLKTYNCKDHYLVITITNNITLKQSEMPICEYHQYLHDPNDLLIHVNTDYTTDPVVLTLDLSEQDPQRFQYVSFDSCTLKLTGSEWNLTHLVLSSSTKIVETSTQLVNVDVIYFDVYHDTISYFKSINFTQIYLRRKTVTEDTPPPNDYPTFRQILRYPEPNFIYFSLFYSGSVFFEGNEMRVAYSAKTITFNIPSYNYTVGFYFNPYPTEAFSITGDYNYNSFFNNYLTIANERNEINIYKGNYLPSTFSFTAYNSSLTWENSNHISSLTINKAVNFYPKSDINCDTFTYNGNRTLKGNTYLYCDTFNLYSSQISTSDDYEFKMTIKYGLYLYEDFNLYVISAHVIMECGLTLDKSAITFNTLEFRNNPIILIQPSYTINSYGEYSASIPEISSTGLSGSARLYMVKTYFRSDGYINSIRQREGNFYPIFMCTKDIDATFTMAESEYDDPDISTCDSNRGFNKELSIFTTGTSSFGSLRYAGLNQTMTYGPPTISIYNESSLSLFYNNFTTIIGVSIVENRTVDLSFINHTVCSVSIYVYSTEIVKIKGTQEAIDHITTFSITGTGTVEFEDSLIFKNHVEIGNVKITKNENFNFGSESLLTASSLNTLNLLTKENVNKIKTICINGSYVETIYRFDFLENGWKVYLSDLYNTNYTVTDINPKFLVYKPFGSITFTTATKTIKPLYFALHGYSYTLPDWSEIDEFPFVIGSSSTIRLYLMSSTIPINLDNEHLYGISYRQANLACYREVETSTFTSLLIKKTINYDDSISIWSHSVESVRRFGSITFQQPVTVYKLDVEDLTATFDSSLTITGGGTSYFTPPSDITVLGAATSIQQKSSATIHMEYKLNEDVAHIPYFVLYDDSIGRVSYSFLDNKDLKLAEAYGLSKDEIIEYFEKNLEGGYPLLVDLSGMTFDELRDKISFVDDKLNTRTKDIKIELEIFTTELIYLTRHYAASIYGSSIYRSNNIGSSCVAMKITKIKKAGLSTGAIIGIVVGCVVLVAIIVIIVVCCCVKKKSKVGA